MFLTSMIVTRASTIMGNKSIWPANTGFQWLPKDRQSV